MYRVDQGTCHMGALTTSAMTPKSMLQFSIRGFEEYSSSSVFQCASNAFARQLLIMARWSYSRQSSYVSHDAVLDVSSDADSTFFLYISSVEQRRNDVCFKGRLQRKKRGTTCWSGQSRYHLGCAALRSPSTKSPCRQPCGVMDGLQAAGPTVDSKCAVSNESTATGSHRPLERVFMSTSTPGSLQQIVDI